MQASDMILGLLIIILCGWAVMISVQQNALSTSLQALEVRQVAQGILVSPERCPELAGHSVVKATSLREKEYLTTVGFDADRNQAYFCFYE